MENSRIIADDKLETVFDAERGVLTSLIIKNDGYHTNYIGNKTNISYPSILKKDQWMGDWRFRVWRGDHFEEELTSVSRDIRKTGSSGNGGLSVIYEGPSSAPGGLHGLSLRQDFSLQNGTLLWKVELANNEDSDLEVGEASLAFLTNTDFTGIFTDPALKDLENWQGEKQRRFHEERVFQHLSLNIGSSYAFLQRPCGDWPGLLFQSGPGTPVETAYQIDKYIANQFSVTFEGPYYLSLYSNGALKAEEWKYETEKQRYSLCGNRSLILKASETKTFLFRFVIVRSPEQLEDELVRFGQVAVNARPGMTAPISQPIRFYLRCKNEPKIIPASSLSLHHEHRKDDRWYYSISSDTPGQKELRVFHNGMETRLFFFLTENPGDLIKKRARFIAKYQFYDNPLDLYKRHHTFLPYDDNYRTQFTDSNESWQVGALDEYCLPPAMFLAEKNVLYPDPLEIKILDSFIDDSLFGILQDPATFLVRRGMYWEEKYPSDIYYVGKWSKDVAESTNRSFNYPFVADIYFGMYRIAKAGNKTRRSAADYLEMMYRTAMNWFEIGENKWNGAPAGATITAMLDALKEEQPEWFGKLNEKAALAAKVNNERLYPFGSELYVDQTPHNQLQAMLAYYGYTKKLSEVYRITLALRGGRQPAWFLYGNEKRGNVCCWYGTPLNTRVLYEAYESIGEQEYLRLGYGGISSFLSTLRHDGAAHGWYLWWPDRTGFDSRSLDTDMGVYGYLFSARAYAVEDCFFGPCGYGCTVTVKDDWWFIEPYDGVGHYLYIGPEGFKIQSHKGKMIKVSINRKERLCNIEIEDCDDPKYDLALRGFDGWKLTINGKYSL
jgi:hypothetical protein